jgi:hypothetical protein
MPSRDNSLEGTRCERGLQIKLKTGGDEKEIFPTIKYHFKN